MITSRQRGCLMLLEHTIKHSCGCELFSGCRLHCGQHGHFVRPCGCSNFAGETTLCNKHFFIRNAPITFVFVVGLVLLIALLRH